MLPSYSYHHIPTLAPYFLLKLRGFWDIKNHVVLSEIVPTSWVCFLTLGLRGWG